MIFIQYFEVVFRQPQLRFTLWKSDSPLRDLMDLNPWRRRTRIFFTLVLVHDVPNPNPYTNPVQNPLTLTPNPKHNPNHNINPNTKPDPNSWTGTCVEKIFARRTDLRHGFKSLMSVSSAVTFWWRGVWHCITCRPHRRSQLFHPDYIFSHLVDLFSTVTRAVTLLLSRVTI